ncbi:tRNA (adenosine(37)-N6)-threonylcarbamoyltransferase complex ATPase subunit type 1 TsaE [Halofilum ochraceum]|uniref:tRNA (adenosine(37)-N6)-threonylcarbamoyltransferase complex ATPase subunit type 1 TsaE n=1 Tax=Halofilum ochraceum TaxID=1611323 RepID=UPI0008363CA5|nr:tRNA (adenosine(37)-N6)-threonylcarbamoyltransferase complex ATPase subunit type 1 TsaE [Halofilum ochraceum]
MADRSVADEAGMAALGHELAGAVAAPAVIFLEGTLGAGKTTLARAFLQGLGYTGAVRSPTYTLVESYPFETFDVHHLDLYRIADPDELEFLGIRDLAAADAIWLVEWAERGADRLPAPDYVIRIAFDGTGRRVTGLPDALATPA